MNRPRVNLSYLPFLAILILTLTVPMTAPAAPGPKPPPDVRVQAPPGRPLSAVDQALHQARLAGDQQEVRRLLAELGWSASVLQAPADPNAPQIVHRADRALRDGLPGGDVRVNDPSWQSAYPSMAVTAEGELCIVVDDMTSAGYYLDIYRSTNDGYSWIYHYSIYDTRDLSRPSLAVAQGNENRLLIAYEVGRGTAESAIYVHFADLEGGSGTNVLVESSPLGVTDPSLCTDASTYSNWWPYLTYKRGVLTKQDRHDLVLTRSFDYGATWHPPTELTTDVAWDTPPDIDFGMPGLFVAYAREVSGNQHDLFLLRSLDLGGSFDPEVTLVGTGYDETDPRVAAATWSPSVVVAFTREYTPENTDIEAVVSSNGGDWWDLCYLPWTPNLEMTVDLATCGNTGLFHAAFWSEHEIHYTWAEYDAPQVWSPVQVMNQDGPAAYGFRPAVSAHPGRFPGGCAAWTDTRVELQYHVFFNATYPLGEYLVIVPDPGVIDAVMPLVQWKQQLGYGVSVVHLPAIYETYPAEDDAESIWNYLRDRRDDLKYVLLVGDVDQLPMRALYPDGDPAYPPTDPRHHNGLAYGTDYYYAELSTTSWDLDGDGRWGEFSDDALDIEPEVYVGRIPFNDPEPVQVVCSNIVSFEQDTGAWKRNALLAHGFLNHQGDAGSLACDTAVGADYLRTTLLQPEGWTTATLFERVGLGQSVYPCDVMLSQENYGTLCDLMDFGLINCAAHGNGTNFAAMRWMNDYDGSGYCDKPEEMAWNVFSYRPEIPSHPVRGVVFLNGCSSAPLFGQDPNFTASPLRSRYLVRTPAGPLAVRDYLVCGAAAVIGSSAGSEGKAGWTTPADGNSLSLNCYFYQHLIAGNMPVGEAFHRAQLTYAQQHRLQRAMRVFNYFGDPALRLPGIPLEKRGTGLAAQGRLTGHLDLDAALAMGLTWRRSAGDAAAAAAAPKGRADADIWNPCGELPGCFTVTSLLQGAPGEPVYGTGVMADGGEGTMGLLFTSGDGWDPWGMFPIDVMRSARKVFRTRAGTLLLGGMAGSPEDPLGLVLRQTAPAGEWEPVAEIPEGPVTDICQDQSGVLWLCCGVNGQIWRSDDDGATWSIWCALSGGAYFNSIMQSSSGKYVATLDNAGTLSIIQSENGQSWFPVPDLTGVLSAYTVVEGEGHLYAGVKTAAGGRVYRSDDLNGETWSPLPVFPAEIGCVAVRSLAVDLEGNLLAGLAVDPSVTTTWVYSLDPGEMVWRPFAGGVDLADQVTAILPTSGRVFVGTGNLGGLVYRCAGPVASPVPGEQAPRPVFMLGQNYPNPFNPATTIAYSLPEQTAVTLAVYDVSGRLVRTLVGGEVQTAGPHSVSWNGRDQKGRAAPAGVYIYRLQASASTESRRLVLVK